MATIYEKLLLAKIEATKGTDSVPVVADDAVRVISATMALSSDVIERIVVKNTMGQMPHCVGKETMQLTVEAEWRYSGVAGTAVDHDPLLQACGLDITNTPATSDAYDPLSAALKGVSMYWFEDGLKWEFIGTVGNFTIAYNINDRSVVTFTMSAPYKEPTTTAMPGSAVFQDPVCVLSSSADIVLEGGGAIKVGTLTFDAGNDVQEHYVTGNHEFVVADRNPTITISKDSVSTIADYTALSGETNATLSVVIDGGAGKKTTLTAPVARRKAITPGERAERPLREVEWGLYESTGDDQYQLLYT